MASNEIGNVHNSLLDSALEAGSVQREYIGVGLCFRDELLARIAAERRVPMAAWKCPETLDEIASTASAMYAYAVDALTNYVEKTSRQRQLGLGKRGQLLLLECMSEQADFVVLSMDVHEITRFMKFARRDLGETFSLVYIIDPCVKSY